MSTDSSKSPEQGANSQKKQRVKLTLKLDSKAKEQNHEEEDEEEENTNGEEGTLASPLQASFNSTLPPRKRARTKEEKEQRRIERILRNRRAAHLSREKKKKYIEFLENSLIELIARLNQYKASNNDILLLVEKNGGDTGSLNETLHATRAMLTNIRNNNVADEKVYDDILDKINQNKNLNIVLANTNNNGHTKLLESNPSTPTTPVFVYHNNDSHLRSSNPSTPKTDFMNDETLDTANSLKKLSETPVTSSSAGMYNHKPIPSSVSSHYRSVSGLGISLDNNPAHNTIQEDTSETSSGSAAPQNIPTRQTALASPPVTLPSLNGDLLNMNVARQPVSHTSPIREAFKNEDGDEENAVMIMMSLKNRNSALQQHQYHHK